VNNWFESANTFHDEMAQFPAAFASDDTVKIEGGFTVDFDASGQPGGMLEIEDLRLGTDDGDGNGFLNMIGGTLILNDFDDEALRIGQNGNMGGGIQTGGIIHAVNGGIRIGEGTGGTTTTEFAFWTISGGSLIASGPGSNGRFLVGDKDGNAELNIIGTGPVEISTQQRFEVESNGRLNFTLDANGVTPVLAGLAGAGDNPVFRSADDDIGEDGDPGSMLSVDFMALSSANSVGDILLVNNRSDDGISGQFVNALEGSILQSFGDGTQYRLTYEYVAGSDGLANDLALVAVPEPSTVLLVGLAGLAAVVRRQRGMLNNRC